MGEGCSKARHGVWTEEFVDMINNRHLFAEPRHLTSEPGMVEACQELQQTLGPDTRFVTADNYTRTAINNHFISQAALKLPDGIHPIRVVARFGKSLKTLSNHDVEHLMSLPDTSFGRMAPYLDLIPGMPIQITQNIRNAKGIANGTMAKLVYVIFPDDTAFRLVIDSATETSVYYPTKRPLYALVQVNRGIGAQAVPGLPSDIFPVFPDAKAYQPSTVSLTSARDGTDRKITLSLKQFPFVNAVGSTIYKIQGETLKSMVVVDWKAGSGADKPQQVYLMVSRAISRSAFLTMSPLTSSMVAWAKPPAKFLAEEERLLQESEKTVTALIRSFDS